MPVRENPRPIIVEQGVGGGNRVYPTHAKNTHNSLEWDEFDTVNGTEIPDDYHDGLGTYQQPGGR